MNKKQGHSHGPNSDPAYQQFRRSIENDFVLDVGKVRFREQTGCGWPKK